MRLNNSTMAGTEDLRDLWNQQTPFAVAEDLRPLFHKRLIDSLTNWDMRDGRADWTSAALIASANVFLDDFLLFDVSKPITDITFLEIEKSTLNGLAYRTGGGRTLNANVIDILLSWTVNRARGYDGLATASSRVRAGIPPPWPSGMPGTPATPRSAPGRCSGPRPWAATSRTRRSPRTARRGS